MRGLLASGGVIGLSLVAVAAIEARAEIGPSLALLTVASCAYGYALWWLSGAGPRGAAPRGWLTACLLASLAWRLPLLASAPILSDDVYRYVWDGRVQRLGLNPFLTVPADPALVSLHTPVTWKIDPTNAALPTIYPPAAQLFFRAATSVEESVRSLGAATLLCDLAIIGLLLVWLGAAGRSRWWVLAYAWNPLVALEGAGGAHVDVVGALLVVLSAVALGRGRRAVAALALAAGVAVKFLPLVLVPLLVGRIRWRDAALAGAAAVALYAPFTAGVDGLPLGSLGTYTEQWRFNGPLFDALSPWLGTQGVLALGVSAGLGVAAWARRHLAVDSPSAWAWPMATSVVFMPAIYPWYLIWLTPFLTARATVPLAVWTLASVWTYAVWGPELAGEGWVLPAWVLPAEYGLVAAAAVWAIDPAKRPSRWGRSAAPGPHASGH